MGRTLLRIAVARAHAAGLPNVAWIIEEGEVGQEIARAVVAHDARMLFMGASRPGNSHGPRSAAALADRLRDTTGVVVKVIFPPAVDG